MSQRKMEDEVFTSSTELIETWRIQGKWEDALRLLNGLLPVARAISKDAQTTVYLATGRVLTDQAMFGSKENLPKRINTLDQALHLAETSDNKALLGDVYDAIGFSLHASYLASDGSQESEQELDFFERGLDLRTKHGSSSHIAESTFHIGLVYDVIRQDYDKALPYHKEAYKLAQEADNKMIMSYAIRHIGFTKMAADDLAGAKQAFSESLELRESIGFVPGIAFALTTMARIEIMEKNNSEALLYFKKARTLFESLNADTPVAWISEQIESLTTKTKST